MWKPRFSAAGLSIDPITPEDIPSLMEMMDEMAGFYDSRASFLTTADELKRALFSKPPIVEMLIAREDGEVAGFVNWYEDYGSSGAG